jgi:hypothetical protein
MHHHHGILLISIVINQKRNVVLELFGVNSFLLSLRDRLVLKIKILESWYALLVFFGIHAKVDKFLNYILSDLVVHHLLGVHWV